jgi:hypothetical protein
MNLAALMIEVLSIALSGCAQRHQPSVGDKYPVLLGKNERLLFVAFYGVYYIIGYTCPSINPDKLIPLHFVYAVADGGK